MTTISITTATHLLGPTFHIRDTYGNYLVDNPSAEYDIVAPQPDNNAYYLSGSTLYSTSGRMLVSPHFSSSNSPATVSMEWAWPDEITAPYHSGYWLWTPSCQITDDYWLNCTINGNVDYFAEYGPDGDSEALVDNYRYDPGYNPGYDLVQLQVVGVGC